LVEVLLAQGRGKRGGDRKRERGTGGRGEGGGIGKPLGYFFLDFQ
jgi:hypothetical protein